MFDIFSKSTKQCDRQKQIRGGLGAESDRIKIIVSELTIFWISAWLPCFIYHAQNGIGGPQPGAHTTPPIYLQPLSTCSKRVWSKMTEIQLF